MVRLARAAFIASVLGSSEGARTTILHNQSGPEPAEPSQLAEPWLAQRSLVGIGVTFNCDSKSSFAKEAGLIAGVGGVLDQGGADFGLVCTQEAAGWSSGMSEDLDEYRAENWKLLSFRKHVGFTGVSKWNHQELSVLVRTPPGYHWSGESHDEKDPMGRRCLMVQNADTGDYGEICSKMTWTRNSLAGKGGAIASVEFTSRPGAGRGNSRTFKLVAGCVHLDSSTDKQRNKDTASIVQVFDSYGEHNYHGSVFMGDLNYRLRQSTLGDLNKFQVVQNIVKHLSGDPTLLHADPLGNHEWENAKGKGKGDLIEKYKFACNSVEFHPPTYKMINDIECQKMVGKATQWRACRQGKGDWESCQGVSNDVFDAISMCYADQTPDQIIQDFEAKWPKMKGRTKDKLQLGWLDRVCWRGQNGISVAEDMAFAENFWQFVANPSGDHLPVVSKFTFSGDF